MWPFNKPSLENARKQMLHDAELDLLEYEKNFDFYNVAVRTTRERVSRLKAQVAQDDLQSATPAVAWHNRPKIEGL